jgi:hypothetical protein
VWPGVAHGDSRAGIGGRGRAHGDGAGRGGEVGGAVEAGEVGGEETQLLPTVGWRFG